MGGGMMGGMNMGMGGNQQQQMGGTCFLSPNLLLQACSFLILSGPIRENNQLWLNIYDITLFLPISSVATGMGMMGGMNVGGQQNQMGGMGMGGGPPRAGLSVLPLLLVITYRIAKAAGRRGFAAIMACIHCSRKAETCLCEV